MSNIQIIKEKNAVLVPIKDWEKTQRELARLRKKVGEAEIMAEVKNSIISFEKNLRNGKAAEGKDARKFVAELLNEK